MKKILSKFSSAVLIFTMVAMMGYPLTTSAAGNLGIACSTATQDGNTGNWTLTGTWYAYDFVGQSNQYDTAIFSPSGTLADSSSKDSPDTFVISVGPNNFTGQNNKDDMQGTWSNQIQLGTNPTSISATLYHSQVPGNEASGDATCTFDINDAPTLTGVPTSASIPEMVAYSFDANSTDPDLPAPTLTFSISGAPAGAAINPSTGVFSWTPTEAQGPGVYPFSVSVTDGVNTTTQNITLTVTEVNIAPVATGAAVSTPMNTPINITLSASDVDLPANTLTYSVVANPDDGSVGAITGDTLTYTPDTSFVGSDSFTFKVYDGAVFSNTATINITVSNNAPTLDSIEDKTVAEGSNLSFIATASDPNSNTLTFSITGKPTGATFNTATGAFSWTPTESQAPLIYPITISVTDGQATDSKSFNITATEVNMAPTADDKSTSTNEDTSVMVTLTGSDSDIPVQTITYSAMQPANGTVVLAGNVATYTPNLNFTGIDTFTYKTNDGVVDSTSATVTITVDSMNDVPVLTDVPLEVEIPEMALYSFDANATDGDVADTLTFSLSDAPAGASINSSTGAFSWTPTEAQGPGTYAFSVMVTDGVANASLPITINATEVNLAPVAQDGMDSTHVNTPVSVSMVATDSDIPANTFTYTIVGNPSNGMLGSITGNSVEYTPNTDYVGSDSFIFEVSDGTLTDTGTINITVNNDAPVLTEVPTNTEENPVIIDEESGYGFDANGTDSDEDTLTFSLGVGAPEGASIDPDTGVFSWTPTEAQGPNTYSVTIIVSDGLLSDSQTFVIEVKEVNNIPLANDGTLITPEDTAGVVILTGSDTDLPAQTLTFMIVDAPTNGTIGLSGVNATYTPNLNFNGTDSFTFKTNDGIADSAPATITITVNPVNDKPIVTLNGSDEIAIQEDTDFSDPGAFCTDIEDSDLTPVVSGTVDTNTPGTYILTYICTDSNEAESDPVTREVIVQSAPAMCSDGKDNDEDGKVDFGGENPDPGCSSPNDNDETDPIIDMCVNFDGIQTEIPQGMIQDVNVCYTPGSGSGSSTPTPTPTPAPAPAGEVLGAETTCGIYVDKFLRKGYKNNKDAVLKVQQFLNQYESHKLSEDGFYGLGTENAVKSFQQKYADDVLKPWKINKPTGIFYLTTQTKVNNIMCPDLSLPIPQDLIPFNKNTETPKA